MPNGMVGYTSRGGDKRTSGLSLTFSFYLLPSQQV